MITELLDFGRICAIIIQKFSVISDNSKNGRTKHLEVIIMNVFEAVAELIAERTDRAVEDVKPESTFADLGIDSLDTVEMMMNLEDKLGIEIELTQKVETVADLVSFIETNCVK